MKIPALAFLLTLLVVALPKSNGFVESSDLRREALKNLNVPTKHTQQPPLVSIHPGEDTHLVNAEEPLRLGQPIAFETPLFQGKILIRLQNAPTPDENHAQYFLGRPKRLMQSVVQGRFQKAAKMSEIYVGSILDQPLARKPPHLVTMVLEKAFRKVQPGAIVDMRSQTPTAVALYAGSAQAVSINVPGDDLPDMLAPDIPENVAPHLPTFGGCSKKRMRHLSKPELASEYEYDTNLVYTFHTYNEVLDFGAGTVKVPLLGQYDLKPTVGQQPFKISAISSQGETLYSFEIRY